MAQNPRPSELRKQKAKTELSANVFGDKDPAFKISKTPEKWKKESAVIIAQLMDYKYHRSNTMLVMEETVRKRVMIQDKAAVEAFSEFYFIDAIGFGLKIIKSTGQEIDVSTKDAVEVEKDVPLFYRPYYNYSLKYKKLAVPDLEVGDIIDYYYNAKVEQYTASTLEHAFSPFVFTLSRTYPIMKQKLTFSVDRGFYINFNSYNGAPKLIKGAAGTDTKGRVRANIKTYKLEDTDREKLDHDLWAYQYLSYPTIKFQVYYVSPKRIRTTKLFLGEIGETKSKVTPEEIQTVVGRQIFSDKYFGSMYVKEIDLYLKRNHPSLTDPKKLTEIAYYMLRYKVVRNYYYGSYGDNFIYDKSTLITVRDVRFCSIMLQILKKRGIDVEVFAAVPRWLGPMENLLLDEELRLGLRVGGKNGFYIFPFSNYSTFDYVNPTLEGVEAYVFNPVKNPRVFNFEKVVLPKTMHEQNMVVRTIKVGFDIEEMEKNDINVLTEVTGNFKDKRSEYALYNTNYLIPDIKKYDPNRREAPERGNKARLAEIRRKEQAAEKDREEKKYEVMENYSSDDFDIESYDDFKIIADGRTKKNSTLKYEESFTAKGFTSKAGRNYILEIGALIGRQVELEEKEINERNHDINIDQTRSYTNKLIVTLPEGYSAHGLEELNFNVDNAMGSFISKATAADNVVTIEVNKAYKQHYASKTSWPEMVAFLEAAYDFTQKKVILKK